MEYAVYSVSDDGKERFLRLAKDGRTDYRDARKATEEELDIDAIAEMLDQDAENGNHHAFCGTHKALAAVIKDTVMSDTDAQQLMEQIAIRGGLHRIDQ